MEDGCSQQSLQPRELADAKSSLKVTQDPSNRRPRKDAEVDFEDRDRKDGGVPAHHGEDAGLGLLRDLDPVRREPHHAEVLHERQERQCSRRPVVQRRFHFLQTRRFQESWRWVVS